MVRKKQTNLFCSWYRSPVCGIEIARAIQRFQSYFGGGWSSIAVCMHDGVHPQIDAAIVSEAKPA
jgi:hypothetical protein